jgi:hypothetical protein
MKPTIKELIETIERITKAPIEVQQSRSYQPKAVDVSRISRFDILNSRLQKVKSLRQQMLQQQNFHKSLQAMHIINVIGFEISRTYQFTVL